MTNSSEKTEKSKPKLRLRPVPFSQWNRELPIWQEEETIRAAILGHRIVVLTAPPATGKSTQLPIMMLEKDFKKIVLVVPRVIVAHQLAETISSLLNDNKEYGPDKKVGLATGQKSAYNFADNQVLVMTSRSAIAHNLVSRLTEEHLLILDELHEWSEDQEALNGLVMQRIKQQGFRCLETSATLDNASLIACHQAHVGKDCSIHLQVCADVEERCEIRDLSLSEVHNLMLELKEKGLKYNELYQYYELDHQFYELDQFYDMKAIIYCALQGYDLLIFRCGQDEIKTLKKMCLHLKKQYDLPHEIFEVYGKKRFNEIERAVTYISGSKILLSTNILESGFNPIISPQSNGLAVIDFLDKYESYYDPDQNIKGIRRVKISEAEQIQRRRRTGRDYQGIYIPILIDNSSESSITPEGDDNIVTQGPLKYPIPSIEREELSGILLRLRAHQVDLEKLPLFHSPDQDIITQSLKNLKAINCIDGNGNITDIGRAASRFSILYPSAARIVLEAMALFPDLSGLMYEALLVACILNAGGIIDRHKYERTEKPKWLNIEGAKSFKSDLLLQAHILKNELKVFDTRVIFPDKYITDLQLVPKQIKTIMRDYDELKKLLSSPDMSDLLNKACQMIRRNFQAQSHNELSSDNERLRYCIFISLSTSLCFNAQQLHFDDFFTRKALRSYGHTFKADFSYFPYGSRRSSSDIFKPEQRQCLLKYQDSEPGWIVANLFQHLGKPTLSLYTEIEPQWIVAKNVYQNCTVGMRDLVFCSQGRCKWQRVKFQIDQDVVVDYQVEKEGKNVKPIEVLAESIKCYGQVRDLKHLLLQFENPTIKPESFLNLSDITSSSFKKGYVVEGRIVGLKTYGAFIDIGDQFGLLHISNISHTSIEILHEVFKVDEVIKIMILDIDEERGRILLSLKELEPEPGDILKNRNLVFERAEEMAARYRREQGIDEILSERENEITESDEFHKIDLLKVKRLTNYVIARLYSFVRELITRHQDTWTDSTESDLLAQVCFEWTSNCLAKLPQDWSLDSVKKKHLDEIITSVIERKRLPN